MYGTFCWFSPQVYWRTLHCGLPCVSHRLHGCYLLIFLFKLHVLVELYVTPVFLWEFMCDCVCD